MGHFLLQFEDQRTPLRKKKDRVVSFFVLLRRITAALGLACVIVVLGSIVLDEQQFLISMIETINRATESTAGVFVPARSGSGERQGR